MSETTEDLKKQLRKKPKKESLPKEKDGLSTGSTVLNLACSGNPTWGYQRGKYYLLVGDSASGKTFLALSAFAEAGGNKAFDRHRFIYDNGEGGALMDLSRFFGGAVADRLEPPAVSEDGEATFSTTVEEFYYRLDNALDQGDPFIYILDSMDLLSSEAEWDKFEERKDAWETGKSTTGSYGDGKAKQNSSNLRRVVSRLAETGSILIIIAQTRDNIGFGAQFNPKTRSGGHALRFYATLELWTSQKGHIKSTYKGKQREQGITCSVRVKKNRVTGRDRTADFPIYHSFGIDDVGGCVDYLVEEKYWTETKGKVKAKEFDYEGSTEGLVQKIEAENREPELKALVAEVFAEIEEACAVKRKARY